jgi:mono/diheme cytochrome c family protein
MRSPNGKAALRTLGILILVTACSAPAAPTPTAPALPNSQPVVSTAPAATHAPAATPAAAATPASAPSPAASQPAASPTPLPVLTPLPAPKPAAAGLFGFGQTPGQALIDQMNIDVLPDGTGLPPGSGTVAHGADVYAQRCAACHGKTGKEGGVGPVLVSSSPAPYKTGDVATVGNYWPFATTIFDYVRRAMPFDVPDSLSDSDYYAVVAYLLNANQIIGPNDAIDAQSLPKVQMPNRNKFVPCWPKDCRPDVP